MHFGAGNRGPAPFCMQERSQGGRFYADPHTPSENPVSFPIPRTPLANAYRYEIGGLGGLRQAKPLKIEFSSRYLTRRIRFPHREQRSGE